MTNTQHSDACAVKNDAREYGTTRDSIRGIGESGAFIGEIAYHFLAWHFIAFDEFVW